MLLNKHDCLERANNLLASGDPAALRYACLELRFCIEAVTYEKLRAYASRLPADVLSRWQPPQAVAALVELEGEADEEYTIAVGLQRGGVTGSMETIGEHRTFGTKWLKKHYHKLGRFLHVPNENDRRQPDPSTASEELREYVKEIFVECERVVDSSITFALAPLVEFSCQLCGRKVLANAEAARRRRRVSCLDAACAAEHIVLVGDDESLRFHLDGSLFPCQGCGHQQFVPAKRLSKGYGFACHRCSRRYRIIDQVWGCTPISSEGDVGQL